MANLGLSWGINRAARERCKPPLHFRGDSWVRQSLRLHRIWIYIYQMRLWLPVFYNPNIVKLIRLLKWHDVVFHFFLQSIELQQEERHPCHWCNSLCSEWQRCQRDRRRCRRRRDREEDRVAEQVNGTGVFWQEGVSRQLNIYYYLNIYICHIYYYLYSKAWHFGRLVFLVLHSSVHCPAATPCVKIQTSAATGLGL